MEKKERYIMLSEKTLNYEAIEGLDLKTKKKLLTTPIAILTMTGFCGTLPHFVGYNFTLPFGKAMFRTLCFVLLTLIMAYKTWIDLCKKTQIFKSKKVYLLFILASIILTTVMCVSAYFTTKFVPFEDGSGWEVHMNMAYYFLVYFPILIIYIIVSWYAFLKKISEFTRQKKRKKDETFEVK
jgi:amino acid transporter